MKRESGIIINDGYLVVDRYRQGRYKIDFQTYDHIVELVMFYHESMYLLPDDEMVEVTGIDKDNYGVRKMMKVNEIVFV